MKKRHGGEGLERVDPVEIYSHNPSLTLEDYRTKGVRSAPNFAKAGWLAKQKVREQPDTPLGRLCCHLLKTAIGPTLDEASEIRML